ncbi:MAG TPA: hypothetical protein VF230_12170 [Acidimicrobiales bacterium]
MVPDAISPDDLGPDAEVIDFDDLLSRLGEEAALGDEIEGLESLLDDEWIPLAAAEEAAGVSRSTLRAWYRSGRIASRLMPGPHGLQRLVSRTAVLEQAARSPRSAREARETRDAASDRSPAAGAAAGQEVTPVVVQSDAVRLAEMAIAEARDRADRAEARAAEAEAALRAALERAAAAEAEARILRERERN